jgi:dihydrofolate reductase
MNELPKYVASRSLGEGDMEWNSELLPADDALGAVRRLREQGSGDMQVMGSASLARQLVEHDLVDEYRLMIEPVLLGGGKRIFSDDGTMRPLELVSATTSGTGVQIAVYRPATG